MSEHNLDDLIIHQKPVKKKSKGLLAVFALFVAVVIVGIVMKQFITSEADDNATQIKKSLADSDISKELQLEPTKNDAKKDKAELDQLSNILEDETNDSQNNSIYHVEPNEKPKELVNTNKDIMPDTVAINEEKNNTQPPVTKLPVQTTPQPVQADVTKPVEIKREPKAPVQKIVKKEEPQYREQPRYNQPQRTASKGKYFIQVGSFSQDPSGRFLSVIEKSGFRYKLLNGKLLIGPYGSRESADGALPRVKDKINKSAFIKQF